MKDNKYFKYIFEYEQKVFAVLFAIFLISFLFGCYFLFHSTSIPDSISYNSFKLIFNKNILSLFISFLFGYTVIGFPFLFLGILYNGFLCGVSLCTFTFFHGLKMSAIFSLALFPYYLIFLFCYFSITASSLRLSISLYNVFKEGTRYISPKTYSKPHIIKFVFHFILICTCTFLYYYFVAPLF